MASQAGASPACRVLVGEEAHGLTSLRTSRAQSPDIGTSGGLQTRAASALYNVTSHVQSGDVMNKVIFALRTFLRLALPYFRSEDRWRARALLAGVIGAELFVVYVAVKVIDWNAALLQRARSAQLGRASSPSSSCSASSRSARSSSAWRSIGSARR